MLELVSDHAETAHSSGLEWVVIILILICAALGLLQVAATLGIVGPGFRPGHAG